MIPSWGMFPYEGITVLPELYCLLYVKINSRMFLCNIKPAKKMFMLDRDKVHSEENNVQ